MIEHERDIPELDPVPLGTTGKQLREAREAQGRDIATLSESLHLRPAVLSAIESGDYQGVPELFLKGYVRSYARLLGLDGDALMPQLESELRPLREQEAEREVHTPIFHIEAKKRKKRRIAFWILVLLFLAVVGFTIFSLQHAGNEAGFDSAEPAAPTENPMALAEDTFEGDEGDGPRSLELITEGSGTAQSETDASLDEADFGADPAGANDTPEVPVTNQNQDATGGIASADLTGDRADTDTTDTGDTADSSDTGNSSADAQQASTTATVQFELVFDGDCWIEVRDATGERIHAALQRAGDQLSRSAAAPVSFVIGDTEAIASFSFDGEPVDIDNYPSRSGRAEMTLN